jgi:hypothetical protein
VKVTVEPLKEEDISSRVVKWYGELVAEVIRPYVSMVIAGLV